MAGSRQEGERGTSRYRLVLEGELGPEWASWFGVKRVRAESGRTILDATVRDQAELHGLLRRAHDLHARLISLTYLGTDGRRDGSS